MTKTEFAKYLRVNQVDLSRYEAGQATQGYAMDDLLRILQRYPDVIQLFTRKKIHIPLLHQKQDILMNA